MTRANMTVIKDKLDEVAEILRTGPRVAALLVAAEVPRVTSGAAPTAEGTAAVTMQPSTTKRAVARLRQ